MKNKWKPLDIIIMAVAVCVLAVSLVKLAGIFLEYKAGTDEYSALSEQFAVHETAQDKGQEERGQAVPAELEEGYFPQLQVDFEALKSLNNDLRAWIYIPALEVEYPVVQGSDNDYYLTHTFEKKENKAGAVFMDSEASPQLTDYNTIIYGHNMKNGSMFGKLKKFVRDNTLCEGNPYFYLFTEEKNYKYLIISYYVTVDGGKTYFCPADADGHSEYLSLILKNSIFKSGIDYAKDAPIVTLSTCYGASGGDQRFVVHGVLVETEAAVK